MSCFLCYRIVGNSCQGEFFAFFAYKLEWHKFNQRKFCWFKLNLLATIHVYYGHVYCERCLEVLRWSVTCCHGLQCYTMVLPQRNPELPDPAGPLLSSLPLMTIEETSMAATRDSHECSSFSLSLSPHTRCLPPPQSIDTAFARSWNYSRKEFWSEQK